MVLILKNISCYFQHSEPSSSTNTHQKQAVGARHWELEELYTNAINSGQIKYGIICRNIGDTALLGGIYVFFFPLQHSYCNLTIFCMVSRHLYLQVSSSEVKLSWSPVLVHQNVFLLHIRTSKDQFPQRYLKAIIFCPVGTQEQACWWSESITKWVRIWPKLIEDFTAPAALNPQPTHSFISLRKSQGWQHP